MATKTVRLGGRTGADAQEALAWIRDNHQRPDVRIQPTSSGVEVRVGQDTTRYTVRDIIPGRDDKACFQAQVNQAMGGASVADILNGTQKTADAVTDGLAAADALGRLLESRDVGEAARNLGRVVRRADDVNEQAASVSACTRLTPPSTPNLHGTPPPGRD